jgi:hypothetical protein
MPDPDIRVAEDAAGGLAYAISCPPGKLPAVPPEALLAAWDAARAGAAAGRWGPPRTLAFAGGDAGPTVLAITDRDARCWAEAVDRLADLATPRGLALCLRLLGLIDLLARARWLGAMFDVTAAGVDLHPALLRAAASQPLDAGARFDAEALRGLLSRRSPPTPMKARPMPRLASLLLPLLLLAACDSPRLQAARIDVPMGGAPRGERDPRLDACRAEATRVVQFRERGQTMRADETESGRGTVTVAPFSRAEDDRAGQQLERDRMIQDCLRASAPPAGR